MSVYIAKAFIMFCALYTPLPRLINNVIRSRDASVSLFNFDTISTEYHDIDISIKYAIKNLYFLQTEILTVEFLMCILTDRWKANAPTWNYWFQKFWQVGSKISRNFLWMKNSVKVSMEVSRFLDTTAENSTNISVYQKLRYFCGQYDTIYRYRTDISVYWSITYQEWCTDYPSLTDVIFCSSMFKHWTLWPH